MSTCDWLLGTTVGTTVIPVGGGEILHRENVQSIPVVESSFGWPSPNDFLMKYNNIVANIVRRLRSHSLGLRRERIPKLVSARIQFAVGKHRMLPKGKREVLHSERIGDTFGANRLT